MMDWKNVQLDFRRFLISQLPLADQPQALRALEREMRQERRREYRQVVHGWVAVLACLAAFTAASLWLHGGWLTCALSVLVVGFFARIITVFCGWGLWLPRRITDPWDAEDALEALEDA
jgi:hypothetical protein